MRQLKARSIECGEKEREKKVDALTDGKILVSVKWSCVTLYLKELNIQRATSKRVQKWLEWYFSCETGFASEFPARKWACMSCLDRCGRERNQILTEWLMSKWPVSMMLMVFILPRVWSCGLVSSVCSKATLVLFDHSFTRPSRAVKRACLLNSSSPWHLTRAFILYCPCPPIKGSCSSENSCTVPSSLETLLSSLSCLCFFLSLWVVLSTASLHLCLAHCAWWTI